MLSLEAFKKLSKEELYDIYCSLYKEKNLLLDQKTILMSLTEQVTAITTQCRSGAGTGGLSAGLQHTEHPPAEPQPSKDDIPVRTFQVLPIRKQTNHLLIGSSIFRRVNQEQLPDDIEFHCYSGSTTLEKIKLLKDYPERKLSTVIVQDGTNAISKYKNKCADDLLADFYKLYDIIVEKFKPDKIFVSEVPPFMPVPRNDDSNSRVDGLNEVLKDYCSAIDNTNLITLNETVKRLPNPKKVFFGNVHFNDDFGLPLLLNCIMASLLPHSTGIPRKNNNTGNPSYKYNSSRQFPLIADAYDSNYHAYYSEAYKEPVAHNPNANYGSYYHNNNRNKLRYSPY